jgi:hypothetical protein
MNINNLVFFDKNGESYNFNQTDSGYWEGADYFLPISTSLYDNSNLFILEKFESEGGTTYKFPEMEAGSRFDIVWKTADGKDSFFLFTVQIEGTGADAFNYLAKANSIAINFSDFGQTGPTLNLTYPLQLNVAFTPAEERAYSRILQIYYTNNSGTSLVLELTFYGEGEDEDERMRVWLENFGIRFNREDSLLLKDYDLKESLPDWSQVNAARKQLLVNVDQVYPYVGTYKGLLNLITLMGYKDVLRVKEYWQDTDPNSNYYQKFAMVDVTDLMQLGDINKVNLIDENGQLKNNTKFKKTEFLALVYEFTVASNTYDDDGLPEVIPTTEFTVDEIFFKLHGLAKKLKTEIIPINVIIKDIIGEFIYFEKFNLRDWTDNTTVEALQINDIYTLKVLSPNTLTTDLKIRDLKPLYPKLNGVSAFPALSYNLGQTEPYQDNQIYPISGSQDLIDTIYSYYDAVKQQDFYNAGQPSPLYPGDDTSSKVGCPVVLQAYIIDFTLQDLDGITFGDFLVVSPTTSSSSNTIGTGTKTFSCVTVQPFQLGQSVKIYISMDHTQYMEGTIAAIDTMANSIDVDVTNAVGFSTSTGWTIYIVDTHFTIGSIKYKNAYEIEWIIDGPQNYHFERRGPILQLATIPHMLPHSGTYGITTNVYDLQGGVSSDYRTFTVKSEAPILKVFAKLQDKFRYDFKNLSNVTLSDLANSPIYDPYANAVNPNGDGGPITSVDSHYLDWYTYSNYYGVGGHQDEVQVYTEQGGYELYSQSPNQSKIFWGTGSVNGQPTLGDYSKARINELYHHEFGDFGYVGDTIDGFWLDLRSTNENTPDEYLSSLQFGGFDPIDISTEVPNSTPESLIAYLAETTAPGWADYRYDLINGRIKVTAKLQQKSNHSIIKAVYDLKVFDGNYSYPVDEAGVTISSTVISSTTLYQFSEIFESPTVYANSGIVVGDRVRIVNPDGEYVEGTLTAANNSGFSVQADESTADPAGDFTQFKLLAVDVIYTFCSPRNVFNSTQISQIQETLSISNLTLDEDLLFLYCPFEDKLKTLDPPSLAPASKIQYWIDRAFVTYDNAEGLQKGFLPSYYDENSFNLNNIKATYDTLIVPTHHPVFVTISNLASNVSTEWILTNEVGTVIQIKSTSYFVWRFSEPGSYKLTVSSTDTRNNTSTTSTSISVVNARGPKEYVNTIEKQLNDRKFRMSLQ